MNQVMISVKDKSSYSELCIIKYKKLIPIVNYFDASVTHPYSTQAKKPTPTPSTTPTITVKYRLLGGLAQLVNKQTLEFYVIKDCDEG